MALVVRVGFVAATTEYVPFADASDYDRHAISLKEEGRYPPTAFGAPGSPSAFRPPGYPYAVAAAYGVTGKRLTAARLMNAVLGVIGVLFVYLIALETWGRRVALLAGSFAAVFPPLVFMAGSLLAENLFVPLVLAATWATLRGVVPSPAGPVSPGRRAPVHWWPPRRSRGRTACSSSSP